MSCTKHPHQIESPQVLALANQYSIDLIQHVLLGFRRYTDVPCKEKHCFIE